MRRTYSTSQKGRSHTLKDGRTKRARNDETQHAKRRTMSRRTFVVGAAMAASLLLWRPRLAFADEPWWDGSLIFRGYGKYYDTKFWTGIGVLESGNGGSQSGTLYTDRWVSAKTPWVEWDISSNQYIRTASKITMQCDFTTELYYHLTGVLEIACGSYNERNASYNLWHTDSGDDTRFSLYHAIDDYPEGGELEESKVVVIDNEAGSGIHKDGAQIWTDYRQYPQNTYSVWVRRATRAVKHSFQLRSWFWNYYYFNTNWYYDRSNDPPIGYSTKWVELYSDLIYINSNAIWGNRVVTLESVAQSGSCLESAATPAAGAACTVSPIAPDTKQQWIVLESEYADSAGTYRFVPVTSLDGAHQLDQSGGGPTMSPSSAQLWNASGTQLNRAQVFWIHGASPQWVFADCSGMALDCGGTSGLARFHSNGYPASEWDNEDHMWHIRDTRFSTNDGYAFSLVGAVRDGCVPVGELIEVPDPDNTFCPGGSSASVIGLRRNYTWVVTDDDFADDSFPEVVGSACLSDIGWLDEQPAVDLVGTMQRDAKLTGLSLRIEGSSLSGGVSVLVSSGGAWRDGTMAGSEIGAVSLSLTGAIADRYEALYRACSPRAGWGSWVSEGESASGPVAAVSGIQVRLEPKGTVQQSEAGSLMVDESWNGKFLTCVVRAKTAYREIPYRGAALSQAVQIGNPVVRVQYKADDDPSPCFEEYVDVGASYHTSPLAAEAGKKKGCSDFDGWYTDTSCEATFEEGAIVQERTLVLYGRSIAKVAYALTVRTEQLLEERQCFEDEAMTNPVTDNQLVPMSEKIRYGTRLRFKRRASIWYDDRGRAREAANVAGAYTDADESSVPVEALKVTGDATLYLAWHPPRYEGIAVS